MTEVNRRQALQAMAAGTAAFVLMPGAVARAALGIRSLATQTSSDPFHLDPAQKAWVEKTLGSLSVRQMAGQLMWDWTPGSYDSLDSDSMESSIEDVEGGVGGIWLMSGLPYERAAKANALQAKAHVPLIVMYDSALGHRQMGPHYDSWILGGGTDIPPAMAFGATDDPGLLREAARIIGTEARATGGHMVNDDGGINLLTDLHNVLGNRCYGDDPELAARMIDAFTRGVHDADAVSWVGFFPGAGGIGGDPHLEFRSNDQSREEFERNEFVPFRTAIQAGVEIVMTSHFGAPAITGSKTLPITVSPEAIRVLREDLGFRGLVMTDAMDMAGVADEYEPIEAAVLAFKAGHDIILGTDSLPAADRIAALVDKGDIPRARLEEAARRILSLKAKVGLDRDRYVDLDRINEIVGTKAHQEEMDEAAKRSIVLLRDDDALVPAGSGARILSVTYERADHREAGREFNSALRRGGARVAGRRVFPHSESGEYDELLQKARDADLTVLSVYVRPQLGQPGDEGISRALLDFVAALRQEGRKVVVVSFGKLRVAELIPGIRSLMMAWSGQTVMQRAAALALTGQASITGTLPLNLSARYKRGDGLVRKGAS